MSTDKYQEPGQFDIKVVNLITGEGTEVDLKALVMGVQIYEDINANCIAGYITLQDTQNAGGSNYYIELEQIKLDLNEATVATLKDMRGRE